MFKESWQKREERLRNTLNEGPKNFLNWKLASPSGWCLLQWTRVGNGEERSALKKVAPHTYLEDVKGSIYRRNLKFLRIAKDRFPETVQANRQQLNPETVQANPGTQTPSQQLKPPLTASWPLTMIHTQMVSLDKLPVSQGDPAMLQAEPSCSTSPTTQEEPPLIGKPSPPAPSVIQRTCSGRIIKPSTRLNLWTAMNDGHTLNKEHY